MLMFVSFILSKHLTIIGDRVSISLSRPCIANLFLKIIIIKSRVIVRDVFWLTLKMDVLLKLSNIENESLLFYHNFYKAYLTLTEHEQITYFYQSIN